MIQSHDAITRTGKKYERCFQLPTKCVASPRILLQAVIRQAGEGNFYIEVGVLPRRRPQNRRADRMADAAQYVLYQFA
jgi:hypothetical protein